MAGLLSDAADAHLRGERDLAEALFARANDDTVRGWLESIWAKDSRWNTPTRKVDHSPLVPQSLRAKPRDPDAATKRAVHLRDGWYCRHCHLPVIRTEVRALMHREYPRAVPWGTTNASQHAAFQALWAQYDHVLPWSRGGTSDIDNIYLTCAACNHGRNHYLLEHFDLEHPNTRPRREGDWDGLERLLRLPRKTAEARRPEKVFAPTATS